MALSHSSAERASSFFRRASRLYSLLAVSGPGTPACIASLFQTPLQAREIAHNRKHHKHPCSCQQCPVKHAPVPDEKKGAQPYQGRHQQDIVLQGIRPVPVQKGMESPGGTAAITKPPRGFVKRALREPAGAGGVSCIDEHAARQNEESPIQGKQFHAWRKPAECPYSASLEFICTSCRLTSGHGA